MITKYASFDAEILEIKGAANQQRLASLDKLSEYSDYRTGDGYLYARITAISSRVNKNHDGWPSAELAGGPDAWDKISSKLSKTGSVTLAANSDDEYGYSTFLHKPIFVDHNNSDTKKARGVIVDAKLHVQDATLSSKDKYYSSSSVDSEHLPPTKVELLLEIDAKSFPILAKSITDGDIDGFSMGCDVERSKCSHCGKIASSPQEYCSHIKMKGAMHDFDETTASGEKRRTSKKSYENCYGIKFFEISAVFDPADETALAHEVIAKVAGQDCSKCHGTGKDGDKSCWMCDGDGIERESKMAADIYHDPNENEVLQLAKKMILNNRGMTDAEAMTMAEYELQNRFNIHPDQVAGGEGYTTPTSIMVKDTAPIPKFFPGQAQPFPAIEAPTYPKNNPTFSKREGSYLTQKLADNPLPQSMHTKAPDSVDTLREEKICPVCGQEMDGEKCSVCGHIEPPEGFNNPDLQKHLQDSAPNSEQGDLLQGAPQPGTTDGTTYLETRKNAPTPGITSAKIMDGAVTSKMLSENEVKMSGVINNAERPLQPNSKPATDEPKETVISDQIKPVTATYRTAMDLIQATKQQIPGENMSTNRVAAEPVDPSGSAHKRVDVDSVGGVDQASNEEASKPAGRHGEPGTTTDVEGKGGVMDASNEEASRADSTESLETSENDNAGFQDGGVRKGPSTMTFDNSNEPGSAVTNKAFPTAGRQAGDDSVFPSEDGGLSGGKAAEGTQPADSIGKADDRVNVLEHVTSPSNNSGPTKTWSGDGGNGVTRQQDPVTKKVDPNIDGKPKSSNFSHIVAAMKLADAEVELGLLEKDKKYDRVAELEQLSSEELAAEERVISRVKTAGLARHSAIRREAATNEGEVSGRLPSFSKRAGSVEPQRVPVDNTITDSGLFL